jgi:hypothetical protein
MRYLCSILILFQLPSDIVEKPTIKAILTKVRGAKPRVLASDAAFVRRNPRPPGCQR